MTPRAEYVSEPIVLSPNLEQLEASWRIEATEEPTQAPLYSRFGNVLLSSPYKNPALLSLALV